MKFIVGNWKMNGLPADSYDRVNNISDYLDTVSLSDTRVIICPPSPLLSILSGKSFPDVKFGAQDCHSERQGAFTGDCSAELLSEWADFCIVGHSERRSFYGEISHNVKAKAKAALHVGMTPIICVGERQEVREQGDALGYVAQQLVDSLPDLSAGETVLVAYEPVWAIGTGLVASLEDIEAMHCRLTDTLRDHYRGSNQVPLLYGGSVKGENAKSIMDIHKVDGVLVGGASLDSKEFCEIIASAL